MHLRWLANDMRLLMRWLQMEPVVDGSDPTPTIRGWRRRSSLFLLTGRGANLLGHYRRAEVRGVVRRSYFTAKYCARLEHDLEVNAFWVSLAVASRDLADQGLYHWVGDDAMKGNYQEVGEDLAPDGWGRYLAGDREILISLEWDRGTDPLPSLHRKIQAYAQHYSRRGSPSDNHVLLVAPTAARERSIRSITAHLFDRTPGFYLWTTRTKLLREQGPLGAIWQELAAGEQPRRRLAELPSQARSDLRVEDSIAKPGWWERRPGGGGGA